MIDLITKVLCRASSQDNLSWAFGHTVWMKPVLRWDSDRCVSFTAPAANPRFRWSVDMMRFPLLLLVVSLIGCGSSTDTSPKPVAPPSGPDEVTIDSEGASQVSPPPAITLAQSLTAKRIHFQDPDNSGPFWADFYADGTSRHSARGPGTYKVDGLKVVAIDFEEVELLFSKPQVSPGDTFEAKGAEQQGLLLTVLKVEAIPEGVQSAQKELSQIRPRRRKDDDEDDEGTPLHKAAEDGDVEVVKKLIASGADVNSCESEDGETPLHRAITRGRIDVVKLLIDSKADLNLGRKRDGQTPLELAEKRKHVEIAQLLRANGATPRKGE